MIGTNATGILYRFPRALSSITSIPPVDITKYVENGLDVIEYESESRIDVSCISCGSMELTVSNFSGIFDKDNPKSPIYSYDRDYLVKIVVMWEVNGTMKNVWTGMLDKVVRDDEFMGERVKLNFLSAVVLAERIELDDMKDLNTDQEYENIALLDAFNRVLAFCPFTVGVLELPEITMSTPYVSTLTQPRRSLDTTVQTYRLETCESAKLYSGKVYFGCGRDLIRYDPSDDTWEHMAIISGASMATWQDARIIAIDVSDDYVYVVVNRSAAVMDNNCGDCKRIKITL